MTARKWYRKFVAEYNKDKKLQRLEAKLNKKRGYSGEEKEWTEAMRDFLREMGKSMNYQVEDESRVVGGKRADQRWIKERASVVAIEHENVNNKHLLGEINKLCNDVSLLKVLITYVSDHKFEQKVEILKERVREAIDGHIDTFSGEVLLVVSGWYTQPRSSSWKAYKSVLSSSLEPLK